MSDVDRSFGTSNHIMQWSAMLHAPKSEGVGGGAGVCVGNAAVKGLADAKALQNGGLPVACDVIALSV